LATFYSKKGSDKTKIEEANINFGVEILEKLRQNNLRKIIYTNTMFKFQEENKDYFYTRTKNKFTDLIKSELKLGEILSELYLDNTFGPNDTRNKIFNQIKTSIINEQISPVANKEAFINLSYIDDVIHCLVAEISPNFGESRLTSNRDYSTQSIFDFLKYFHSKQKVDSSILISAETKYKNLINLPDVNSNFKESDFVNNLINTFNS
jgi:nucleoside-diphosphate-sugar epimerase